MYHTSRIVLLLSRIEGLNPENIALNGFVWDSWLLLKTISSLWQMFPINNNSTVSQSYVCSGFRFPLFVVRCLFLKCQGFHLSMLSIYISLNIFLNIYMYEMSWFSCLELISLEYNILSNLCNEGVLFSFWAFQCNENNNQFKVIVFTVKALQAQLPFSKYSQHGFVQWFLKLNVWESVVFCYYISLVCTGTQNALEITEFSLSSLWLE